MIWCNSRWHRKTSQEITVEMHRDVLERNLHVISGSVIFCEMAVITLTTEGCVELSE